MKPSILLVAASLALIAQGTARADSGKTLNQVRSEMNSGTWRGVVLYESGPAAAAPAASGPAAAAAQPGAAAARSGAPTPAAGVPAAAASSAARNSPLPGESIASYLGRVAPPSGVPLNSAKRLDLPSQGIELSTASSRAADAAAKGQPAPKP
jgi:hypothetical protein